MDLVLGHNQFVGISHISESKSIEKKRYFDEAEKILKVVEFANDHGFKRMVIENHPILIDLAKLLSKHNNLDMSYYVQIPYAQGYIKESSEKGIAGFATDIISKQGLARGGGTLLKSAWNYLNSDYNSIIISTMKIEISQYENLKIDGVFLHNIVTDLLASMKMYDLLALYHDEIKDDLGYKCGYITQNLQLINEFFRAQKISGSGVMMPINVQGYGMNPSKDVVEALIRKSNCSFSAMNVLGGGSFSMQDSLDYTRKFPNIKDIVVGVSSEEHILAWESAYKR